MLFRPHPSCRKISAHEFERGGLLKPIVNTIDGTPTFLSISSQSDSMMGSVQNQNGTTSSINRTQRLSRNELKHLDEKEMIFELVRDVARSRHRLILINFLLAPSRSRTFAMNSTSNRCATKSCRTFRFFLMPTVVRCSSCKERRRRVAQMDLRSK